MSLASWGNQIKYGEYEIVGARQNQPRMLGEGSFGKTFEAVRRDTVAGAVIEEQVAIKVLNPAILSSQSKRLQFVQELLALTKFKHSNLIHYIRCGEENGEVYYAMELCRGGDLVQLVQRFGPLPERAAAWIGLQVATGLREMHQRHRLVHRDIKPSNIMLVDEIGPEMQAQHLAYCFEQQDSLCRVVDFGLVNFAMNAEETPQRFVGSPMYASPEQIREQPIDGRCDLYSLGMTLWYLVQGKGPMVDSAGRELRDLREAMRRNTSEEEHTADLPEYLSTPFREILARLLAKRPEQRFSNAAEAQTAFRKYLAMQLEPEKPGFAVTKIAEPLESIFELGERIPTRCARSSYVAEEKSSGSTVKLCVVTETSNDTSEVTALAERLAKAAELSALPVLPAALFPVKSVVWTADWLAWTEEMTPHLTLAEVLKARAGARKPVPLSEATAILQPMAEALDFLISHGQESVSLALEDIWLVGSGITSTIANPQVLLTPLNAWPGLQARFGMLAVRTADEGNEVSPFGLALTMPGSMQMSGGDLHPVPALARLVYRILNGSEVAAAVQFAPEAYVPAVTLGHASNQLIRDLICRARPWVSATAVLKELCANEGILRSSAPSAPLARVLSPGLVQSPFASAGSTQSLTRDEWKPGAEFVCAISGRKLLLPFDLPPLDSAPPPLPQKSDHSGLRTLNGGTQIVPDPLRQKEEKPERKKSNAPALFLLGCGGLSVIGLGLIGFVLWKFWPKPVADGGEESKSAFAGTVVGERKMIAGTMCRWCPRTGAAGFSMGSPPGEAGHWNDELLHQVELTHGFWLAETETTQQQWRSRTQGDIRAQAEKALADDTLYLLSGKRQTLHDFFGVKSSEAERVTGTEDPASPIFWVNWAEAMDYCRKITEEERANGNLPADWEVTLPTEAEWEYACRAGTPAATYGGDIVIRGRNHAAELDPISWYGGNSGVGYTGRGWTTNDWPDKQYEFSLAGPRVVGQKRANAWGFSDMLGNVSEWCWDWYAPYETEPVHDAAGPSAGQYRTIRGGAWDSIATNCRAARRGADWPTIRRNELGFRVAVVQSGSRMISAAKPITETAPPTPIPKPRFEGLIAGESRRIDGMAFHWCPATSPQGFVMGSPATEEGRAGVEAQHTVVLTRGFWMAETEATEGQWQELMHTSLREQALKGLNDPATYMLVGKRQTIREVLGMKQIDPALVMGTEGVAMPIYWVNWNEAIDYCRRLTDRERAAGTLPVGWAFSLPTEAQWEYACRAGTMEATYAGNMKILGLANAPVLDRIAWYAGNSGVNYLGRGWNATKWPQRQHEFSTAAPRLVGQKEANPWGLRDMIGNVSEWCADWQWSYPPVSRDPVGDPAAPERIYRGGGFDSIGAMCRAASRSGVERPVRYYSIGFRVAIVQVSE